MIETVICPFPRSSPSASINGKSFDIILIAIFFTISITIGSLVKSDLIAVEIVSVSDKIYHFIAYFLLMLSWLYAFFKKNISAFLFLRLTRREKRNNIYSTNQIQMAEKSTTKMNFGKKIVRF